MRGAPRALVAWLAVGAAGFALVPWYMLSGSVLSPAWLREFASRDAAPGLLQAALHGRAWLWPVAALLAAAAFALLPGLARRARSSVLLAAGTLGVLWTLGQGFAIRPRGFAFAALGPVFGEVRGQYGMGLGAALVVGAFAMLAALGLAQRGYFKGDAFVA